MYVCVYVSMRACVFVSRCTVHDGSRCYLMGLVVGCMQCLQCLRCMHELSEVRSLRWHLWGVTSLHVGVTHMHARCASVAPALVHCAVGRASLHHTTITLFASKHCPCCVRVCVSVCGCAVVASVWAHFLRFTSVTALAAFGAACTT
jgi:hypothetical protein